MQFSLPIVATRWRGIPSIIRNEQTGFLVQPKNAEDLSSKLEALLKDAQLRTNMGKAGRELFVEKYSIGNFHKQMENLFQTC